MSRTEVVVKIEAPIERVFDTVAHIENFKEASPDIVDVEFLSDTRRGVGTRFRETRRMGKRQATTELEVTEYAENDHLRIVSDAGGTIWDTLFVTKTSPGGGVELTVQMEARAYKLASKLFNPLIKGAVRKAIEKDMHAVKAHCEERR